MSKAMERTFTILKDIIDKSSVSVLLSLFLLGILLCIPMHTSQAEEVDPQIISNLLTMGPQNSDASAFLIVNPNGDAISRTINIGNILQNNPRAFHTSILLGVGSGVIKFRVSGNRQDAVLFASAGNALVTDEEGNMVFVSDFGYAESDGAYTLEFRTESSAIVIINTAPLYAVGEWGTPVTLELTVSME
jgi:hypothetical protein